YALTVQNKAGTTSPLKLVWTLPATWTGAAGGGEVVIQGLAAVCLGSPVTCSVTTPSITPGAPAVYTFNVTPPTGETQTREIIMNIQSTNPACVTPTIVDSVKAIAVIPGSTSLTMPTSLTVSAPAGTTGEHQLNLTWIDGSNNETGFQVERVTTTAGATCSGLSGYSQIATVLRSGTQTTSTGGAVYYASTALTPSTYYCYRVRAYNSSGYSAYRYPTTPVDTSVPTNTPVAGDITAPGTVLDLAVHPGSQRSNSIGLTWTAPGDDGYTAGTAALSYDLRYSMSPIGDPAGAGEVDWSDTVCADSSRPVDCVVQVAGEPLPKLAGQMEQVTVTGLIPNTIYYVALKTADEVPNPSSMSNGAGGDNPTDGSLAGRTALRTGFNLISVPLKPSSPNPLVVFGDDVGGTIALSRWNSTGLGVTDGSYTGYGTSYTDFAVSSPPTVNYDAVGVWHLDEAAGTTAADSSGYGNTGTLPAAPAAPTWDPVNKKFGVSGLSFDGDDYVEVLDGGSASINLNGATQLTLEAWIKTNNLTVSQNILDKRNAGSTTNTYVFQLMTDAACTNSLKVRVWSYNGATYPFGADTTTCVINSTTSWYHVVVVYSNAFTDAGKAKIYVDGVGQSTTVPSFITSGGGIGGSSLVGVTESLFMGRRTYATPGLYFNGFIDEAAIWNRALDASEIWAHAMATGALSPTALLVQPGEGYFLLGGGNNPVIDVPAGSTSVATGPNCGISPALDASDVIPLQLGWNLIGDPFPNKLTFSTVYVRQNGSSCVDYATAVTNGWVGNAVYSYNGSGYSFILYSSAVLDPWKGYWLWVRNNDVVNGNTYELIVPTPP
ncbi:MAG TPA: LamG domain-containing protein, partial [Nitrospiria bacterium]